MKNAFVVLLALLVCACGNSKLDATYSSNMTGVAEQVVRITFKPDGTARMSLGSTTLPVEMLYEVSGNKVKVAGQRRDIVFAVLENGDLVGEGMRLQKEDSLPLKPNSATLPANTSRAYAAPAVEGEYQCDDCRGYMTVKKESDSTYKLWLGVGGGSCGGDVFATGAFTLTPEGKFIVPRKEKGKSCTTEIQIEGNKAFVSDSCISRADEANSTCAIFGGYAKRS